MLVSTSTLDGHVDTIDSKDAPGRRRRRLHSDEFEADAIAAAAQPGMSMAAVAMARGINANLLRRWVREAEVLPVKALPNSAPVHHGRRFWPCKCLRPRLRWATFALSCGAVQRRSRWPSRWLHSLSARAGCTSCRSDPRRRRLASGGPARHARRHRVGAGPGRQCLRFSASPPCLPFRQPPCHHLFEVAQTQGIGGVPANAHQHDLQRVAQPLEHLAKDRRFELDVHGYHDQRSACGLSTRGQ